MTFVVAFSWSRRFTAPTVDLEAEAQAGMDDQYPQIGTAVSQKDPVPSGRLTALAPANFWFQWWLHMPPAGAQVRPLSGL
jgi:hypothetical protein